MNRGVVTYWVVIFLGYAWAAVELAAGEPFDAFVLFVVTYSFQAFRNAIIKEITGKDAI